MIAPDRVPPAGQPFRRLDVRVLETSAGWSVRWQSDRMTAPGIWYLPTEHEAQRVARAMQTWVKDATR